MYGYGAGETGKNRFCGEGQLRRCGSTEGSQPFVPGCRGGSALLGSRGGLRAASLIGSRVKRLAQGKLMPASTCTGYYLTQNFAGLAALPPSPAQNIFAGRRKNV